MAPKKIQDELSGHGNNVSRWYKRRIAGGKCTKAGCTEAPMTGRRRCLSHAQEASRVQLARYYAKKSRLSEQELRSQEAQGQTAA